MFDIIIKLAIVWKVVVVDYDPTISKHTALLEGTDSFHKKYSVAVESATPYSFKDGNQVFASINMECSLAFGVDEEASDATNTWVTYRAYICNAKKITYGE